MRCFHVVCTLIAACLLPADAAQQQALPAVAVADRCAAEIEPRIESAIAARKYNEALAATEEFGQVAKARFGLDSRCYADALAQRAVVLQLMDRMAEAGPSYEQALALFRKRGPPDDPKLTLTLNDLGVHHFHMRQYEKAARGHEEALELRRKRKPLDEIAVAESLHNLADAYRYLRRAPDDILKLYQEALEIKIRLLKPDDVSIGHTMQNLASAQEDRGDLSSASRSLEQTLALYRRALPPDDPRIAAVIIRVPLRDRARRAASVRQMDCPGRSQEPPAQGLPHGPPAALRISARWLHSRRLGRNAIPHRPGSASSRR